MAAVDDPKSVNEALSRCQGPYEWGKRDCMTVAKALVEFRLGRGSYVNYADVHTEDEKRRYVRAVREHGTFRLALLDHFWEIAGVEVLPGDTPILPGDMVILGGTIDVEVGAWDTEKRGALLGYVTDEYEILHWYPYGLRRAAGNYKITEVVRCRL